MSHPSSAPRSRTRGILRAPVLTSVLAIALAGAAGEWAMAGGSSRAAPVMFTGGDTQVVYGPTAFSTPNGNSTNHVERFAVVLQQGRRYTLTMSNTGLTGGSVVLNGSTVATGSDLSAPSTSKSVEALGEDTIQVTVQGSAGASTTISLVADPDPTFNVYGPETFTRTSGTPTTDTRTFSISSTAAAPYFLHIVNGNNDGTQRISSGTITLNGVTIVSGSDLSQQVASLVTQVSLSSQNTLAVTLAAKPNGFLSIRITATDTTPPAITINSPAPGLITRDTTVAVMGSVQDETPTTVTVNGQLASMNGTSFTATAHLTTEGTNTIQIVATDAAGHSTDSTRMVIRDTQQPVLTVNAPPNNAVTKQTSITVSGTVTDQTAVTVNANGVPLPVDGSGSFTGSVPLNEGANIITVTATDAAGNQSIVVRSVMRDTQAPVLAVTAPTDGAVVNADHVTVTGTVTDATTVTVTANGTPLPVASGAFSGDVPLSPGPNTISVVATDAATNSSTVTVSVTRQTSNLPPDPSTVATPMNPTVATNLATANAFLYSGPSPIQTDVPPGTIDPVRAGVVRGRVISRDGQPLSGATVSVAGHPEFGQTLSRADGMFDLAVNAGGPLVINYARTGFLQAQRTVDPLWQDYVFAPDVALVPLDSQATVIDFAQPAEVARGSVVTDKDGTRQATLIFPQGTTATLVRTDSTTQTLASITVRATEYTVGPTGPAAMPGPLPAWSAYTYAVELSADEGLGANVARVQFSQPVALYVDNFIGFQTGVAVPTGFYDRATAPGCCGTSAWVPSANGRVVAILDTVGPASLDVDGSGAPASDSALAAMGITTAERTRLSQLYKPGQTLWRVPITHFSSWDCNWIDGIQFPDAVRPQPKPPRHPRPDQKCNSAGSIIGCEDQTLGEVLPVTGSPVMMTYSSDRTAGYKSLVDLDVAGDIVSPHIKRMEVYVTLAGRQWVDTLLPPIAPNTRFSFVWDGRDAYGRLVQGEATAHVVEHYFYPPAYLEHFEDGVRLFGTYIYSENFFLSAERQEIEYRGQTDIQVGGLHTTAALGGWDLSVHHAYDPNGRVLYLGAGNRVSAQSIGAVASRTAGTGVSDFGGDGGPSRSALVGAPVGIKVTPDGSIYFADQLNHRIRKIAPDGTITTVAGNGNPCTPTTDACGDGGPATAAQLNFPTGVDVGPDGCIYIGDQGDYRVRRVGPDGIITTIAGTGVQRSRTTSFGGSGVVVTIGPDGDGGPATQALLGGPLSVAVGPDGSVYFTDIGLIRRVTPDSLISTMVGNDSIPCRTSGAVCQDSQPARQVPLDDLFGLTFGPDGSLYTSEFFSGRVWQVTPQGLIRMFAGNGSSSCGGNGSCGDGGPAVHATVDPWGLAIANDGSLIIADLNGNVIRRVSSDGTINTIAGVRGFSGVCSASPGTCGDGGPALQARFFDPATVAFGPDGSLYVGEIDGNRIRRFAATMPGFSVGDIAIASQGGGTLYQLDANGRHLRTLDTRTATPILLFNYDSAGRLSSIVDQDSLRTSVDRDGAGVPLAVVSPFGQRTTITLDNHGLAASTTNPATEVVQLHHDSTGLLDTLVDANGSRHRFAYDSLGRLIRDDDPDGGFKTLSRSSSDSGYSVTLTTALGRQSSYRVSQTPAGVTQRTFTAPEGLSAQTTQSADGSAVTVTPNGMTTTVRPAPDPRFGMQSPLVAQLDVQTPGGLHSVQRTASVALLSDPTNPLSLLSATDSLIVNGRVSTTTFSANTGLVTLTSPAGRQSFVRLDSKGRIVMSRVPGLDSATVTYDSKGRVVATTQGIRTVRYGFDASGRLDSIVDPLGRVTTLRHDSAGRVVGSLAPDGRQVALTYDPAGHRTAVTPPGRQAYTYQYTPGGLLATATPPSVGDPRRGTHFLYNLDHQLAQIVRPEGDSVRFTYDGAGRRDSVVFGSGSLSYQYSPTTGDLAAVTTSDGGTVAMGYDGPLPTSSTWTGPVAGSVQASFDNNFRLSSLSINGANPVSYQYDPDGLVVAAGNLAISRDSTNGLPLGATIGSLSTAQTWTTLGQLSSYSASVADTSLYHTVFTRDTLGRITEVLETIQGQSTTTDYGYDSADRLAEIRRNGQVVASYQYDSAGNRLTYTGQNGTLAGSYDAQDRLLSYGNTSFAYSPSGALLQTATSTDTTRFGYDELGELKSASLPSGDQIQYVLDGAGRRIGKKKNGTLVQGFLYQGTRAVAELDGSNQVVSEFVYGTKLNVPDYIVKGSSTYGVVSDNLGSVRLVVDLSNGSVVQRLDYDEFGNITLNTNPGFQPFAFAGGIYDVDTKLTRLGVRDYDAATGRFTTKDPLGFDADLNSYRYAGDDPVNVLDPIGMDGFWDGVARFAAGAGHALGGLVTQAVLMEVDPLRLAQGLLTGKMPNLFDSGLRLIDKLTGSDLAKYLNPCSKAFKWGTWLGPLALGPIAGLEGEAAEGLGALEDLGPASSAMNAARLADQLAWEDATSEASSAFNADGTLSEAALDGSREAIPADELGNPEIPDGFSKYSTQTFNSPSGPFQVHFYYNPATDEVFYGLDYKTVFNNGIIPW